MSVQTPCAVVVIWSSVLRCLCIFGFLKGLGWFFLQCGVKYIWILFQINMKPLFQAFC